MSLKCAAFGAEWRTGLMLDDEAEAQRHVDEEVCQSKCSQTPRCPGHTVLRLCTATGVGLFVGNNSPPWGMPTWPSYVHFREWNPAAQRSGEDHPRFEGQQGVMLTKFFTLEQEFLCSTRRTTDEAYPCNLCISKKLFALVFQMDDI